MSKFYRLMSGKMIPDETGVWTLRAQVDIVQRQLDECRALNVAFLTDAAELQRQNYVLAERVKTLDASARDLLAHRDATVAELQRQLAEARALIEELDNSEESLPKGPRYAIEAYLKRNPK